MPHARGLGLSVLSPSSADMVDVPEDAARARHGEAVPTGGATFLRRNRLLCWTRPSRPLPPSPPPPPPPAPLPFPQQGRAGPQQILPQQRVGERLVVGAEQAEDRLGRHQDQL